MVLRIVEVTFNRFFPTQYLAHTIVGVLAIVVAHAFSQGRKTKRERDLHARTFIVTGGFTPLGLTLLHNLASRGAHIIALSPLPVDHPRTEMIIDLLRTTTNNESIYAEECDLTSPASIRAFSEAFLKAKETRVDGVVFGHEYTSIGRVLGGKGDKESDDQDRKSSSLATFFLTTLLLPGLLVAPVERDIRIINVTNPLYAASIPSFISTTKLGLTSSSASSSTLLKEGHRSLMTILFTRHLQRVLDSLPSRVEPPKPEADVPTVPVVDRKKQRSNIVAVSVSPGISRVDTVGPLMGADWGVSSGNWSWFGVILYTLLYPFLRILSKTPNSAIQSVLHVLFLPTPFKVPPGATPEEVLKPGALYAECGVVPLSVQHKTISSQESNSGSKPSSGASKSAKDARPSLPPDSEYGGEAVGRAVWEAYEAAMKEWEGEEKRRKNVEGKEKEKVVSEEEDVKGKQKTL